jgi:hypothetical protein
MEADDPDKVETAKDKLNEKKEWIWKKAKWIYDGIMSLIGTFVNAFIKGWNWLTKSNKAIKISDEEHFKEVAENIIRESPINFHHSSKDKILSDLIENKDHMDKFVEKAEKGYTVHATGKRYLYAINVNDLPLIYDLTLDLNFFLSKGSSLVTVSKLSEETFDKLKKASERTMTDVESMFKQDNITEHLEYRLDLAKQSAIATITLHNDYLILIKKLTDENSYSPEKKESKSSEDSLSEKDLNKDFMRAVNEGHMQELYFQLSDVLSIDPTAKEHDKMIKYAEQRLCDNLDQPHDGEILSKNKEDWTLEYYKKQKYRLEKNFSRERRELLRDMAIYRYKQRKK